MRRTLLTLAPATITRRLRAAGVEGVRSTTVSPGVVRVSVDGATSEVIILRARFAAATLVQQGYDVSRSGALITVTLPEPPPVGEPLGEVVEATVRAAGGTVAPRTDREAAQRAAKTPAPAVIRRTLLTLATLASLAALVGCDDSAPTAADRAAAAEQLHTVELPPEPVARPALPEWRQRPATVPAVAALPAPETSLPVAVAPPPAASPIAVATEATR